ncbi:formate/nitrite transporter family protein [Peptoniphilus stercorisuis]|uniref:Nitrite transporter NirC n=1 Tax=Peptoniphilus stercorisuis TaxID=1436965 RepID=A0ABS4KEN2_9FIRM|nr:formate/nitrite transporter family protein [Peptoniphilus stercorisuis]MBP2025636.1 nitrite transporter NirC [Peptoniphilus stercorisuis]
MYSEIVGILSNGSLKKKSLYEGSKKEYLLASMMAGFFIGIGILIMSLSNLIFKSVSFPIEKLVNGFVFSLALSLVMTVGGELFTGNVLVLSMGSLDKKLSLKDCLKICSLSYLGNLFGAIILSILFLGAEGSLTNIVDTVLNLATTKVSYSFSVLFFKGIMCNILVCLGVLAYNKMENEVAKLIMVFWCILPFIALGFEHSIANMTCFTIAKIVSSEFTFAMIFRNLIPVTLGNILGGLIVSLTYFSLGKNK